MKILSFLVALAAAGASTMLCGTSRAGDSLFYSPTVGSCTTINCESITLHGTVNPHVDGLVPWTALLYARKNECLRVEITQADRDIAILLVSPSSGATTFMTSPSPVVKLTAATDGWFVAVVVNSNTLIRDETDFTLRYGRYATGNVNCT